MRRESPTACQMSPRLAPPTTECAVGLLGAELPRLPACQGPKAAARRPAGPSLTGRQARKKRLFKRSTARFSEPPILRRPRQTLVLMSAPSAVSLAPLTLRSAAPAARLEGRGAAALRPRRCGDCACPRARLSEGLPLQTSRRDRHGRNREAPEPARFRPRQAVDRRFRLAGDPAHRPAGARGGGLLRDRAVPERGSRLRGAEPQGGDPLRRPGLGARRGQPARAAGDLRCRTCRCSASATAR